MQSAESAECRECRECRVQRVRDINYYFYNQLRSNAYMQTECAIHDFIYNDIVMFAITVAIPEVVYAIEMCMTLT